MEFERFFNEKDDRFLNDSKVNPLFDIGFIRDRNRKRKFEQIEERNPFKKRYVVIRKRYVVLIIKYKLYVINAYELI